MTQKTTPEVLRTEGEAKDLLRFSTAGSVDDGKSTLIGRLLHDSKSIYEDHLASITTDRDRGVIDWALLTDGLKAEREQGITIDVAYRYFSTPKRKFIIADTPGHEQYTRNMVTGCSTSQLAIILVDARHGLQTQSKRHAFIASLLRIPRLIVAVNKMDLVDFKQDVFDRIKADFSAFAAKLDVADVRFIPISALLGDNVVDRSDNTPWYDGVSLLTLLETVYVAGDHNLVDFRFPVQYVSRPDPDFRGFSGKIVSGKVRAGDEVLALPSMMRSKISEIVTFDGSLPEAAPPQSVTLTLTDEIDLSRGDMLVFPNNRPRSARYFEAMLVWMDSEPLDLSRTYYLHQTTQTTRAEIHELRYRMNVNSLSREAAETLDMNDIGRVIVAVHTPLAFDTYEKNRATGSFILVDETNNHTAAAGMIIEREPARELENELRFDRPAYQSVRQQETVVSEAERIQRLSQKPVTLWFTGLVSSGKVALARALERTLFDQGAFTSLLSGGSLRRGLSRELDFSPHDTAEHLRRAAETAAILNQSGLIAICAFVSPSALGRQQARELVGAERFIEIYLDADLEWCQARDKTGVYAMAEAGTIANLAGVDLPYEPPPQPDLVLPVMKAQSNELLNQIMDLLRDRGIFPIQKDAKDLKEPTNS